MLYFLIMNWMSWQIDYLLFLQNFRVQTHNIFDWFFSNITTFGTGEIILILMFGMYWCFNKKIGIYMIHTYCLSYLANIILKLSFCIYRPWILDLRVHPLEGAIKTAPGYSFPSGHTAGVTSCFGSFALSFWQNKWIRYSCFFIIFSVMLSRNYLGVHTPQDVIVSFILTFSIAVLTKRLFNKIEKNEKHYNVFIIVILLSCMLAVCYILFKNYPIDYVNGKILYDPTSAKLHSAARIFNLIGAMAGCFIETKLIKFDPNKGIFIEKIFRLIIGLLLFHLIEDKGFELFKTIFSLQTARCVTLFTSGFFVMFIYPLMIKLTPSLELLLNKRTSD